MDPVPLKKVAVLWRGDRQARDTETGETSRLKAVFSALAAEGFAPEPAVYGEAFADEVRDQLLGVDAVLVFVDPVSGGARRQDLDDLLREVAARGVLVSGHPDVLARIGVKAVLHTTRELGWGTDTHLYERAADFEAAFPGRLASGPRVLKQNRSNDGRGVWKVTALYDGSVEILPARPDLEPVRLAALAELFADRAADFDAAGGLVDQPFQPRLLEGMVRCYMSGGQVAGFGHQMVTALGPPEAGSASPRLYTGPDDPRFQILRVAMEHDWTPRMIGLLGLTTDDLPVIWDADFLLGPKSELGEDSYVLCEINANSVFPMPDEAPAILAATLRTRLAAKTSHDLPQPEPLMTEPDLERRALLGAGAVLAVTSAPSGSAHAAPIEPQPRPLPFDPKAVPGLSERLLRSHYDANYTGAVVRLGAISAEFAGLDPATAPGFKVNGLKREELIAWNSMILHEIYFAGLVPVERPSAALAQAVERDFGSHERWAAEFAAIGKALGGGSGWVLLTWSRRDGRLVNTWAADHTMALADSAPLLALDMYEHAYHMDFGPRAAAYVDAFMKAFSWRNANEAFRRASAS